MTKRRLARGGYPAAVLAEMLRVCSPDGRIAINDLSPEPEKAEGTQ
jgi:ubiquinone/menaquinone biosynthesis C-methylase UbiE